MTDMSTLQAFHLLAEMHEDLIVDAACADVVVCATPLVNLRRLRGKCIKSECTSQAMTDVLGMIDCLLLQMDAEARQAAPKPDR